jgi:hypothetical protein
MRAPGGSDGGASCAVLPRHAEVMKKLADTMEEAGKEFPVHQ